MGTSHIPGVLLAVPEQQHPGHWGGASSACSVPAPRCLGSSQGAERGVSVCGHGTALSGSSLPHSTSITDCFHAI